MENCGKQAQLQSNRLVLLKLKQAQYRLQQIINIFQQGDQSNLEAIKQSQRVQCLLNEVCNLVAKNHVNHCVADLMKKGEIGNATEEIKRLHKYSF